MEISSTVLVALMFVGLLSIGIGNILIGLATVFDNRSEISGDWIHIGWTILLLLVCFDLFWNTIDIFSVQDWVFGDFLYIVLAPILIIFAGQVLHPDLSRLEAVDLRAHYMTVSREFFILLALVETWQIGVDFLFGTGLTGINGIGMVTVVLLLMLAFLRRPRIHHAGIIAAWMLFLFSIALQISGSID